MATRALIGYLDDNGVLTSTYNHYDGYPDHLGKILDTYYSRNKRARDVANKGYISYFEDDGDIVSKNPEKKPYKLNLNDGGWEDALYSIAKEIDSFGADYGYIWYEDDGDWVEIKNTGTQSMIDQLANQLASAATMFGPVDEEKSMKERRAVPSDRANHKLMDKAIDKDEKIKDMKKENIDYRLDPYDDKEEVEGMIIKLVVGKRGVSKDVAKSFIDTHYEDIIKMSGTDDILDEFDEFFSVNYETGADYMEEENIGVDLSDAAAGDSAIEKESASGAFEEAVNWRGETLKEQFKRLSK